MVFFFKNIAKESEASSEQDITKCPFLQNINEPTSFSFSSSMAFPMPVLGAKGPIFEDGPNFNLAFSVFHGQNGVVPLSRSSTMHSEKLVSEPATPQFCPLAAKAATISLSAFGPGGPFGFDAFSQKLKNQQRKSNPSKKETSSQGESMHEATSNEWLETGNCPIAKSYRAVSHVLPLVAKALQPPPGMKFKCPPPLLQPGQLFHELPLRKHSVPNPSPQRFS